eukprot:COSAG01_NODE_2_length_63927_cov_1357.611941_22_plen_143_part_00
MNTKNDKNKSKQGFTLIELLITVIVIGIISSIAIPNYSKIQKLSKENSLKTTAHTIQMAIESYHMSTSKFPDSSQSDINKLCTLLETQDCLNEVPKNPFTNKAFNASDPSGKIAYSYDKNTDKYMLKIMGHKNKDNILTLEN